MLYGFNDQWIPMECLCLATNLKPKLVRCQALCLFSGASRSFRVQIDHLPQRIPLWTEFHLCHAQNFVVGNSTHDLFFFGGVLQRAGTSHCRNPATGGFCLGFGPLNSSKWHSLIIDKAYIKKATESVQKGWRLHPRRGDFSLLKHLALQIVTPQKPLALVLSLVVFFEFHLREMALYPFISGTWLQYNFFAVYTGMDLPYFPYLPYFFGYSPHFASVNPNYI